jgi:anti-sigma regulatory factor (Ser/Thr protein kinase)
MSTALRAAFLPSFLPDVEGIGFTGVYRPIPSSDQVGGDWYDAFVLPNGVIAFTMGDVSGHGLTAAASMLRIREGLRMTALTETSPGRVLGLQNRMLSLGGDIFATAVVAFVDPRRGRMTVAVAGHPSPVLVRRGVAEKLPVHGLVLGASEAEDFEDFRMILEPGDAVAFYTDGLIECEKAPIEGELRLLEALQDDGPERLEEMVDQLLMQGQADDATIVMLSYHLAERSVSWHFESDNADSAQSARAAFCYHLRRSGVQPDAISRAELVFGELVGNVVRHAPGPIEINLSFQADDAVLAVRDRGHGFAQRENVLPDEPWSETGRGLFLVEAYAGSAPLVLPRRQGGTNVVATIHGATGGGPLGAVPSVAPSVAEYA